MPTLVLSFMCIFASTITKIGPIFSLLFMSNNSLLTFLHMNLCKFMKSRDPSYKQVNVVCSGIVPCLTLSKILLS